MRRACVCGETFGALARIRLGMQDCLYLGNLNARRDWEHAKDFIEAQWLMLQQERPEDFVIATGEQHSVREFVEATASELGMSVRWEGSGADEKGYDAGGRCLVRKWGVGSGLERARLASIGRIRKLIITP